MYRVKLNDKTRKEHILVMTTRVCRLPNTRRSQIGN